METGYRGIQSDNHFNLIIFECDEKFYVSCKLKIERLEATRTGSIVPVEAKLSSNWIIEHNAWETLVCSNIDKSGRSSTSSTVRSCACRSASDSVALRKFIWFMNINICKTGNPFEAKRILIKVYHFRRVLSTELIWSLVNLIKIKHNSSRHPVTRQKLD